MTMQMRGRGRPSRSAVLASVDEGVRELARVGGLPSPTENAAIWEDIWYEEAHHSTAIEGNTLLLKQVRVLLETGVVTGPARELREILEVQAYAEAARWVYSQALPGTEWRTSGHINVTELREIHRLVVEPVWRHFPPEELLPDEGPGSFRRHNIAPLASGVRPPDLTQVPQLVSDWIDAANEELDGEHAMLRLARLHASFEQLHPFRDGNGRTGRLLLNLLLVRHGYPPAVILKAQRAKYLLALRRADPVRHVGALTLLLPEGDITQRPDSGPLAELIARAVKTSIDRFLLPGLAGPHRLLPLSALANQDVSALGLRRAAEKGRLVATFQDGKWYSSKQAVDRYLASRHQGRGSR
jgi:fido (protein-threonine AMPylation protein)